MDKNTIINYFKKHKQELKTKYNIKTIVLFGSYSRNEATINSDIDLAYIKNDSSKMTFDDFLNLQGDISKDLNCKIDLINFEKLNPLVKLYAKKDFIYV